jgi:hypothetical protein|nr:MAG TPA: peptidoglycan-recognition protein [Caudoviricetes sp.]
MRLVNLDEIYDIATNSKDDIWALAEKYGRTPIIVAHWSAARYDQTFDDYHINIDGEGRCWISTDDFADVLSHTYMRNSGAVGITLCACYGATTQDLGEYAPTEKQIEVMAQVVAVVAKALWITIDKYHVMTHSEAADNYDGLNVHEDYGAFSTCERWDLLFLGTPESPCFPDSYDDPRNGGNILRGKSNYYSNQL